MTPLETEADPNIRVGPLRWGRPPVATRVYCRQLPTAFDNHYAPLWYRPMTGSVTVLLLHVGYI